MMKSQISYIDNLTQPKHGYIEPSKFKKIQYNDSLKLEEEKFSPIIVDLTVDYLTRFMMGIPINEAFQVPIEGYINLIVYKAAIKTKNGLLIAMGLEEPNEEVLSIVSEMQAFEKKEGKSIDCFLNQITGLDDKSIFAACKASIYDLRYKNFDYTNYPIYIGEIEPDQTTINNIRVMVNRTINFFRQQGVVEKVGFRCCSDGNIENINSGMSNYLIKDTMWDLKTLKRPISCKNTLKLFINWLNGQKSNNYKIKNVNKIGLFNPRLNTAYLLEISKISKETIETISKEVMSN